MIYYCNFFNSRTKSAEKEWVMGLEIKGNKRTEILYNLLSDEWMQEGDFLLEDEELPGVILDFVQILSDVEKYDNEEMEYRLKLHGEFNLSLESLLSPDNKGIDSLGIIKIFCDCIKESWEYEYDYLKISYSIDERQDL